MIAADFVVHAVPPWVQFVVSGFGYLLAAVTLGVLMVEFHLNVRKDRRIDRLERRLRRSRERCGFLATQNRALFERLEAECAGLREALTAARYAPSAVTRPHRVRDWVVPTVANPRRRYWVTWLCWPGTAPNQLPIEYGPSEPRHLVLDPCLRPPAPTENELGEWLEEYVPVEWPPQRNTARGEVQIVHGTAITPGRTGVLLALLRVYERDGRATVQSVVDEAGLSSVGGTYQHHLVPLRDAGLVDWEPNRAGTLRPLVGPVPFGTNEKETTRG